MSFAIILFSNIGYLITMLYSFINLIAVIFYEFISYEKYSTFIDWVLSIDVFSWPLFAIVSLATFIAMLYGTKDKNQSKTKGIFYIVSHILFTVIGFVCLYIIFENSF